MHAGTKLPKYSVLNNYKLYLKPCNLYTTTSVRFFSAVEKRSGPHISQSLEEEKRNLDFSLNLGHNDYYKEIGGGKMSLWSRLKFMVVKKSYKNIFRNKYQTLLKAIEEMKYYQLEQL